MCQQAIEKLVKGLYILYLDDDVPRIHDIPKLLAYYEKELPEALPPEHEILFHKLSGYYLKNRYPDYKTKLSKSLRKSEATAIYIHTKEAFAWLMTLKP